MLLFSPSLYSSIFRCSASFKCSTIFRNVCFVFYFFASQIFSISSSSTCFILSLQRAWNSICFRKKMQIRISIDERFFCINFHFFAFYFHFTYVSWNEKIRKKNHNNNIFCRLVLSFFLYDLNLIDCNQSIVICGAHYRPNSI